MVFSFGYEVMLKEASCQSFLRLLVFSHIFNTRTALPNMVADLLFRRKEKLHVDLGDLDEEKGRLSDFLKSNLKVEVTLNENKLMLNSERIAPQDLQRAVTKFVYRRNLNSICWVSLDGDKVRINKFKNAVKKSEKDKKKSSGHQTITQSWGL